MTIKQTLLKIIGCEFEKLELTKILDNHYKVEKIYPNGLVLYSNGETKILYDPEKDRRVDGFKMTDKDFDEGILEMME